MVRSQLVDLVSNGNPELTAGEVETIVSVFFEAIAGQLIGEGRVELRGFGTFTTRVRDARTGRNPSDGQAVAVCATRVPHFKPSRDIHSLLNA